MAVHLNVPIETLVELVDQLSIEEQQLLLNRLQGRIQKNGQAVEEKMKKLRAAQFDIPINQAPSPRREDWYDDDGR